MKSLFTFQVPFDNSGGIVYVWIGKNCTEDQTIHAEEIGEQLAEEGFSLQKLQEGEEPENFFWVGIGGKKDINEVKFFLFRLVCLIGVGPYECFRQT